jgi:hypothetical protein
VVDFRIASARPQAPLATAPFHSWSFPDGTPWTEFHRANGGYLLRFPGLADFDVSADALDVTCFPATDAAEAPETIAQHLYLNQVLPLVLSKRGKLVFHASAVEVPEGAIAFVAVSGRGKSTLAASFAINGSRFLTDDGLVVEAGARGFDVLPSHPSIRLWEDSEQALIAPGATTAPALHYTSKSRFLAGDGLRFCAEPRSLRRAYFLGDGSADDISIQPMSATDALVEWVKHSFLLDVEEKPRLASHFDQVARLANEPIHYRLDFPRRFEDLPRVRQAVAEHAREGRGHGAERAPGNSGERHDAGGPNGTDAPA